ncbi:aminotransferase class V-fold PLP-dependent enzyme [candidate division KSB1 bacterium]|nr:aminotransferase class V-fold PLP-dependent enzyme [candidate division KSB1 bacterium]
MMDQKFADLFAEDSRTNYLNHAAVGMMPRKTSNAMKALINELSLNGEPEIEEIFDKLNQFRLSLARLLTCVADEIAFIHNTTEGLSIALHSIDLKPGENIIVQADAFPASLYIVHHSFPDVQKKYIPLNNGEDFYERLSESVDKNSRAIVIDHVHFLSGFRIDLVKISEVAAKHGLYLIVDGIQAVGAIKVALDECDVDFYCAGGMKWLLGPMGTGFLYVNQKHFNTLKNFHVGWLSAEHDDLSTLYPVKPLKSTAPRYERANFNLIGLYGLVESLNIILETEPVNIEKIIMEKTGRFIERLKKVGCEVLTTPIDKDRSGIVTFRLEDLDSTEIYDYLERRKIKCSLREGWVRIACHFFNSDEQLDQVVNAIEQIIKKHC